MTRERKREIIKEVIDIHDPIRLLSLGCPADEYLQEACLLETAIQEANSLNVVQLSDIISDIFCKQFDEILDKAVCDSFATDINLRLSI